MYGARRRLPAGEGREAPRGPAEDDAVGRPRLEPPRVDAGIGHRPGEQVERSDRSQNGDEQLRARDQTHAEPERDARIDPPRGHRPRARARHSRIDVAVEIVVEGRGPGRGCQAGDGQRREQERAPGARSDGRGEGHAHDEGVDSKLEQGDDVPPERGRGQLDGDARHTAAEGTSRSGSSVRLPTSRVSTINTTNRAPASPATLAPNPAMFIGRLQPSGASPP